jgi:hypothetical protein
MNNVEEGIFTKDQLSGLHKHLLKLIEEISNFPYLQTHPFLRVLEKREPPIRIEEIYQYCINTDPFILLIEISEAVEQANIQHKPDVLLDEGKMASLVAQMSLVAGERIIREEINENPNWVNGLPSIAMVEELAAAMVAATWLNLNIQIRLGSNDKIEVVNLISDRAELQFNNKNAEETIEDEIIVRVSGSKALDSKKKLLQRDIKTRIDMSERKTGARLMIGLGSVVAKQSVDGELRRKIKDRWGIEVFLYADTDSQLSIEDREKFEKTQNSLMSHFESILPPLFRYPLKTKDASQKPHNGEMAMARTKLFISYAHKDDNYREYVVEHLGVLENQGIIDVWDDRSIGAGEDWYDKIDENLRSCKVAVLLISAAFLKSNFISRVEVPALLGRHEQDGMRIMPLLIRECPWPVVDWLKTMQMRPEDAKSLSNSKGKRDKQLAQFALEVANCCKY